jgi:hypothetical protein
MKAHHIDFIDVIEEVEVPAGCEDNVKDKFIDNHVAKWRDVIGEMKNLALDAACFTRSTFTDIPRIKSQIINIEDYCNKKDIRFGRIVTPSRAYPSKDKQREWDAFFKPFANHNPMT